MNFFQRRRLQKEVRHLLHEARHARNMRADLARAEDLERLGAAEQALREAAAAEPLDEARLERAAEQVSEAAGRVYPPRSHPGFRENLEILVVAIAVAMAFRAYFIQPFKIPTGSMQPTLYGITADPEYTPGLWDKVPFRYFKYVLTGERYVEVRAKASGPIELIEWNRKLYLVVNGYKHRVYPEMLDPRLPVRSRYGTVARKGELIAKGVVRAGDHIFVDKIRYNFTKPDRGDVVVFTTEFIRHPQIAGKDHYIKRLVGLPGERISVHPPYLVVDGERVTEPYPFQRLVNDPMYSGYSLPEDRKALLRRPTDEVHLSETEFLPFGDNTNHSLDGRFFGGVPTKSLIGPAFAVYWPFGERWGRIR